MKTIRCGSFETNSSSTHAIIVPKSVKEEDYSDYDSLDHDYGFGREECRLVDDWDEKLVYTYIMLDDNKPLISNDDMKKFEDTIMAIWKELEFQATPTPKDIFKYLKSGRTDGNITGDDDFYIIKDRYGNYVDHSGDIDEEFLRRLINDYEFVKRFIFNKKSYITIGGDEYRGYNIKTIGFEYDYDEHYYVNNKGEKAPDYFFDKKGRIKEKYCDEYFENYNIDAGGFYDKLNEYAKDNDVYLKGN